MGERWGVCVWEEIRKWRSHSGGLVSHHIQQQVCGLCSIPAWHVSQQNSQSIRLCCCFQNRMFQKDLQLHVQQDALVLGEVNPPAAVLALAVPFGPVWGQDNAAGAGQVTATESCREATDTCHIDFSVTLFSVSRFSEASLKRLSCHN